jgi:hypothetical protein
VANVQRCSRERNEHLVKTDQKREPKAQDQLGMGRKSAKEEIRAFDASPKKIDQIELIRKKKARTQMAKDNT